VSEQPGQPQRCGGDEYQRKPQRWIEQQHGEEGENCRDDDLPEADATGDGAGLAGLILTHISHAGDGEYR
jgi:hypothetical protein